MATLGSCVLLKLVEEMGSREKFLSDQKPVLLQIRSIILVLAKGDLWPNQDDIVLYNQLQLGQLLFVKKLEAAHPVPMLKGIGPFQGLYPCVGNPEDLFAVDKLADSRGASDLVMKKIRDVENTPQGRYRSLIASNSCPSEMKRASCRSESCDALEREMCAVTKGFRELSSSFIEKDSDSDCTRTLSSLSFALTANRRKWNGVEVADTPVVKDEMKPTARCLHSACVSVSLASDDNLAKKLIKTSSRISMSTKNCEQSLDSLVMFNLADDNNWLRLRTVIYDMQEVLRHRDVAVLATVEALQEAFFAETMLKCLRWCANHIPITPIIEEGGTTGIIINKFFDLQDDLAQTQLIVQSFTNIYPLRARFKTRGGKCKGTCNVKIRHKNDSRFGLAVGKETSSQDWAKGSALSATADLEKSLHNECRKWFLTSSESYLDEVLMSKSSSMESDSHVAEMMCQIKKVGDWLEAYGRVKKRFMRVLLKYVERTCMVLDHMNAVIGDRQL
ncbi:hypothetical protein D8674_003775 [Pyrus ussuriensis x Pyrus communis]|uniref:Uncharacterized protein n=1 Tax=Pyrus ussuriensis x Pyrus communis TaxID=2448454 RepID=A0A5N5FN93_9ROSA|nr:hypothetical protein D8674_003775 [Pyrus ussuriensis x Pyrus communis]